MEKVSALLPFRELEPKQDKKRKPNEFYELCKFASDLWNDATPDKPVTPNRFFRDCKKHRSAYHLAKIDFLELSVQFPSKDPKDKARLYFGMLKKRKTAY